MKEYLINPTTYKPEVENEMIEQFLKRIGVSISESLSVSIRVGPKGTIYGFKATSECKAMSNFLIDNEIEFSCLSVSTGARYPYHIQIKK